MNNLTQLKQYKEKSRQLKLCNTKIKEIQTKLENWDKLKASSISDMPIHHDTESGDKIGDIVILREKMQQDLLLLEIEVAELNSYIIDVDSKLDCLDYSSKWILEKIYKEGLMGRKHKELLHKKYTEEVKIVSRKHFISIVNFVEVNYKKME